MFALPPLVCMSRWGRERLWRGPWPAREWSPEPLLSKQTLWLLIRSVFPVALSSLHVSIHSLLSAVIEREPEMTDLEPIVSLFFFFFITHTLSLARSLALSPYLSASENDNVECNWQLPRATPERWACFVVVLKFFFFSPPLFSRSSTVCYSLGLLVSGWELFLCWAQVLLSLSLSFSLCLWSSPSWTRAASAPKPAWSHFFF